MGNRKRDLVGNLTKQGRIVLGESILPDAAEALNT
jgi:hypothetical protein